MHAGDLSRPVADQELRMTSAGSVTRNYVRMEFRQNQRTDVTGTERSVEAATQIDELIAVFFQGQVQGVYRTP